jgi:hypothetical protein
MFTVCRNKIHKIHKQKTRGLDEKKLDLRHCLYKVQGFDLTKCFVVICRPVSEHDKAAWRLYEVESTHCSMTN